LLLKPDILTCYRHLACAAAEDGFEVAVLDLDPQASIGRWARIRKKAELPPRPVAETCVPIDIEDRLAEGSTHCAKRLDAPQEIIVDQRAVSDLGAHVGNAMPARTLWVDIDERKRPKSVPKLFGWETPQGWREGQRPRPEAETAIRNLASNDVSPEESNKTVREIEAMTDALAQTFISWRIEDCDPEQDGIETMTYVTGRAGEPTIDCKGGLDPVSAWHLHWAVSGCGDRTGSIERLIGPSPRSSCRRSTDSFYGSDH
jgi:hypothetical protein